MNGLKSFFARSLMRALEAAVETLIGVAIFSYSVLSHRHGFGLWPFRRPCSHYGGRWPRGRYRFARREGYGRRESFLYSINPKRRM